MTRLSVLVVDDYDALSHEAAAIVERLVAEKPSTAMVVPTGETPAGLYRELERRRRAGTLDASGVRVFQLDEYVEIGPKDRRSLFGWAVRSFLDPLGIGRERVVRLSADGDVAAACAAYDRAVEEAGGYDLAILGIGGNGHLGFNEPPSDASTATREVLLSPETMAANARYWGGLEHVPPRAVTVGMKPLLGARRTLLLASGSGKRDIVRRALLGPVTPQVPASYLQRSGDVTVILDRAAWNGDGAR